MEHPMVGKMGSMYLGLTLSGGCPVMGSKLYSAGAPIIGKLVGKSP